jgi:hypothetical protein
MSKINLVETVSIQELRKTIPIIGKTLTPVIVSEPGVGKTSLLKMMEEDLGDKYDYIYVDCPVKDMSDIGMVIPNHSTKTLEYYVASLFKMDSKKPKVICLDELMKAPKLLQVIFTRMMLERMVGDVALPEGSIIFATSNNSSDGVGDSMLAHAGNRVCIMKMAKPSVKEWLLWASESAVHRSVRSFVASTPSCLSSYLTGDQDENPYIFNPKKPQMSFVSPRSLAKSSIIVENKEVLGENATMVALAGTIGISAAKQMSAFLSLESQLPDFKDIIKSPDSIDIPKDMASLLMVMFQAVDVVETQDELGKFMKFVKRVASDEVQAIFFTMVMRAKRTVRIARNNEEIKSWAVSNHELFGE